MKPIAYMIDNPKDWVNVETTVGISTDDDGAIYIRQKTGLVLLPTAEARDLARAILALVGMNDGT